MKKMILVSTLLVSAVSFAAVKNEPTKGPAGCPPGTVIKLCKSTPRGGDSELVAGFLDSVAVCQTGRNLKMVFEKDGEKAESPAVRDTRAGGSGYISELQGVVVNLSWPTNVRVQPLKPGKIAHLSVLAKGTGIEGTSTYTCNP